MTRKKSTWPTLLSVLMLASWSSACGDDGGGAPPPKRSAPKKGKAKRKKKQKKGAVTAALVAYPKIDEKWRKTLKDQDFIADASGEVNRDPFRSFVYNTSLLDEDPSDSGKPRDLCTADNVNWRAPGYSIRDLELSAIIKRGRSNALFVDKSKKDIFILRQGDCLGQEKAVVEEINVKYVRLVMTPDAAPGSAPVKKDFPLHPKELDTDEDQGS